MKNNKLFITDGTLRLLFRSTANKGPELIM